MVLVIGVLIIVGLVVAYAVGRSDGMRKVRDDFTKTLTGKRKGWK